MSIRELTELGLSKYSLYMISKDPDAPVIFTPNGGKALFETDHLDDYLKKNATRKGESKRRTRGSSWKDKKKKLMLEASGRN